MSVETTEQNQDGTKYHFPVVYQKEPGPNGTWSVTVIGLEDSIFTAGDDLNEAKQHAQEAIGLHLNSLPPEQLAELEPYKLPPVDLETEVVSVVLGEAENE